MTLRQFLYVWGVPLVTRQWYQGDLLAMDLGCARDLSLVSQLAHSWQDLVERQLGLAKVTDGLEHLTTGPDF